MTQTPESTCITCVNDFEDLAERRLDAEAMAFFRSGADDQTTTKDNAESLKRWKILPRVLRGISSCDMSTTILGHKIDFPVCIGPSALHTLAHPNGEIETAKAARDQNIAYTMSTFAGKSMEEIAAACPSGLRFFQLYVWSDEAITREVIARAERAGCTAILLTVDGAFPGKKRPLISANFDMRVRPLLRGSLSRHRPEIFSADNLPSYNSASRNSLDILDHALTWKIIDTLRTYTSLPIIAKGIITVGDALEAVAHKVDGIIVSNHGGRQIDTLPATINVLGSIVKAVDSRCEVYVDGGFRLGTDIFKALALGARAVFLGRPVVYSLAYQGSEGVNKMLEILKSEFETVMSLAGCAKVSEIDRNFVIHENSIIASFER